MTRRKPIYQTSRGPVKDHWPEFQAVEDRLMEVIADVYGLQLPMPEIVKDLDLQMLATERRDVMGASPLSWRALEGIETLPIRLNSWTPRYAKSQFMRQFRRLFWGQSE